MQLHHKPAIKDLVWLALDQLKEQNLLSDKKEIVSKFNGISRREIIRRSRHLDIIVQELNGEILVYNLKTNKAYCLN